MPPRPGLSASVSLDVTDESTAISLKSGDVPVLGTPRIIALCEEASVLALVGHLEPGETSVGMRVQFDHLAPSGVGSTVRADVTLEKVEGRRLTFTVSVCDDRGLIGAGKLTRVVVDRERFLKKVN